MPESSSCAPCHRDGRHGEAQHRQHHGARVHLGMIDRLELFERLAHLFHEPVPLLYAQSPPDRGPHRHRR